MWFAGRFGFNVLSLCLDGRGGDFDTCCAGGCGCDFLFVGLMLVTLRLVDVV